MPAKGYTACLSCGLSTTVTMRVHGKNVQALRKGEPCPVCKRKVKVGKLPAKKVFFSIKEARAGKRTGKPRRRRVREGGGKTFIPRATYASSSDIWDNLS